MAMKDDVERWQKTKAWDYDWVIKNLIASQTCASPTTYLAGAAPKNDVRLQQEYRKCRIEIHPDRTKILNNQSTNKTEKK